MEEILSVEHFNEIKQKGIGYIAITDHILPVNRVHEVLCGDVSVKHFHKKVIESGRKNGKYYFVEDYFEALDKFHKMQRCSKCLP
ncbi:hypothetical protein [Brevibacillus sp. NRS-1366]|uniref:hypothetical protein n=1 Tax=Brevibacillus sp. NRS-1366 TaxID=3233899 RepID=UPI003D1FABC4